MSYLSSPFFLFLCFFFLDSFLCFFFFFFAFPVSAEDSSESPELLPSDSECFFLFLALKDTCYKDRTTSATCIWHELAIKPNTLFFIFLSYEKLNLRELWICFNGCQNWLFLKIVFSHLIIID